MTLQNFYKERMRMIYMILSDLLQSERWGKQKTPLICLWSHDIEAL